MDQDTEKLLGQVDAGIRMAVDSIGDILPSVEDEKLRRALENSLEEHRTLETEVLSRLRRHGEPGQEPSPLAKGMSRLKTEMKLSMDSSDDTAADLVAQGCDMGIRSVCKITRKCPGADKESRELAGRLTQLEERLSDQMRDYLERRL